MDDRSADLRIDWRAAILLFIVVICLLANEAVVAFLEPRHLIAFIGSVLLYSEIANIFDLLRQEDEDDVRPAVQIIPLVVETEPEERKAS